VDSVLILGKEQDTQEGVFFGAIGLGLPTIRPELLHWVEDLGRAITVVAKY
jgi:hypothetical protein